VGLQKLELNSQLLDQVAAQLTTGLDSFNERLAQIARQQLYPGHGYRTGKTQRSTQRIPARRSGNLIEGGVESYDVQYSLFVHGRYRYIYVGLEQLMASAPSVIAGKP
jgi:hypothetical protein